MAELARGHRLTVPMLPLHYKRGLASQTFRQKPAQHPTSHGRTMRRGQEAAFFKREATRHGNPLVSGLIPVLQAIGCMHVARAARVFSERRRRQRTWLRVSSSNLLTSTGEVLQTGGSESRPLGKSEAKFCSSRGFDPEEWQKHASPTRYIREISGLFFGSITTRVIPVVLAFTVWAAMVEQYSVLQPTFTWLPALAVPLTPFELTAPLLGLLLVFRTDKSYDRHKEGNEAVWALTARLTDLVRGVLTNTSDGDARSPRDAQHICRIITDYHTWLLTCYLLQESDASNTQDTRKGQGKSAGFRKKAALNRQLCREDEDAFLAPSHVQLLLSQELNRLPRLNEQQRQGLDAIQWEVTGEVTRCERLLRSPIPLGYTRSTVRFLWLWLALLPCALTQKFQELQQNDLLSIELPIVIFFISLCFLSLEDVAVQIEEPFAVSRLRLSRMARWFEREVEEVLEISRARYEHLRVPGPASQID
eukprot:TRINITY_DN11379_c0_g1_i1.p1 TRINITY_DN11379_c0_g1~~TRINITY_DN11379_c0_g1_i1.p1  ORF type:complete len:477 (+),score=15.03 TRINITY_DN11379_c0_g1_i1:125-1555(+)